MKEKLTVKWGVLILFLMGVFTFTPFQFALSQQPAEKTITGKVTDATGKPMSEVTVGVKGTNNFTLTDANGTFTLKALTGSETVVFSYVGHTTRELALGNRSTLEVSMVQDAASMDNVVVVGYGTRKRTEITGATTSISGDKLRSVPTANITQALQGQIAGVVATPSGFRPGAGSSIRIRGNRSLSASNEPLFVVDGFPVSYTINDMNPADIETIDVLKDAAATAIYGVRGANGVVQVTTRRGKSGKTSVSYMGSKSVEKIMRPLPVFNGPEIADAWRQAFFADKQYTRNRGNASTTNPLYYYPDARNDIELFWKRFGDIDQWNSIKDAYSWRTYDLANNIFIPQKRATTAEERALMTNLGITTQIDSIDIYDPSKVKSYDWLNNEGLRNGTTDNHSISVTSGTDKIKAALNLGYFKQKGIEYAQDYTRYSAGGSIDFKPVKALNFGITMNYAHSVTNTSTSSYGNAAGMIPLVSPYDTAGNWILTPNGDQQIRSAVNDRNTVFDETTADRFFGNIYAELNLYKGLKFRSMFGLDQRNSIRGTFNGSQSSIQGGSLANASQTRSTSSSWVWDNILTYTTQFKNDHSLNITLLQELQSLNRGSDMTMSAQNLIFEEQKWYSLNRNVDAVVNGSGSYRASQYLSYMGRIEYGFKNKYLLTLSNRYDNSSVLSKDNQGAWFPSVSVAWQLDRENFFEDQQLFNSARFRVGYGVVGNASIDPYQTGGPLNPTNYNWGNGTAAIGAAPSTFKTPELGWEKTSTLNVGLEFSMLNRRISGAIDVYKSKTEDLLQNATIPGANGVTNVFVNLGEVQNKGIEIMLTTQNIVRSKFRWSTDWMFSANKEKIVDIDGSGNSNFVNLWLLGQPLEVYWGYKADGIFQYADTAKGGELPSKYWVKNGRTNNNYAPGRIRIQDANGDSLFSSADRVILGSHNPKWIASLTNNFTYKNWDLSFMIYARVGGLYRVPRPGLVGRYQSNKVNYWTPSNPSNEYQQPTQTSDIPQNWEALTYRDATQVRVRNVTLTYRLPKAFSSKLHMNNFALYFTVLNPILWHNASDYDPETVPYREFPGSTTNQVGPTSYSFKSYVFGVRVDL